MPSRRVIPERTTCSVSHFATFFALFPLFFRNRLLGLFSYCMLTPARTTGPGSCGLPSPVNEVKIVDMTSGKILAAKGVGEIYIKGPNVAEGMARSFSLEFAALTVSAAYWNNEKATKEAFSADGWFQTYVISLLLLPLALALVRVVWLSRNVIKR